MPSVTVTSHLLRAVGSDQNALESRRVRTVGADRHVAEALVVDNGGIKTIWVAGDSGLTTFDFGEIQVDPNGELADGAADAELVLEIASASYVVGMQLPLEVTLRIPGKITDDVDGALEDVDQIRVKNNNANGDGDLQVKMVLFGRA